MSAKTNAERQDEKRKRDEAKIGLKQLNVKAHKDDHQAIKDFVKHLNDKRGI